MKSEIRNPKSETNSKSEPQNPGNQVSSFGFEGSDLFRISDFGFRVSSKRRLGRDKFRDSLRGMKLGIRGHSSFFVHFFFAALVLATAIVLRCDSLEWCLLLGCIGLVITAELFNSAVETIYHGLDDSTRPRVRHCLDIAAGAVLLASITAAVIGSIIFLPKLAAMLVHFLD